MAIDEDDNTSGRKPAPHKRVLPRISAATGGPMPGVDVTDGSALQEADDLEYVARAKRQR